MLHVVLFEPEIPGNTGNIMRTCVATNTHLHLIKPLGFSLDEKYIRRSGVNYIEHCHYTVYENWEDFVSKNHGKMYFYTRYGHRPHSSFDYSDITENIYLAMSVFALCSALFTYLGVIIGRFANKILGVYANILGAIILFILGFCHLI